MSTIKEHNNAGQVLRPPTQVGELTLSAFKMPLVSRKISHCIEGTPYNKVHLITKRKLHSPIANDGETLFCHMFHHQWNSLERIQSLWWGQSTCILRKQTTLHYNIVLAIIGKQNIFGILGLKTLLQFIKFRYPIPQSPKDKKPPENSPIVHFEMVYTLYECSCHCQVDQSRHCGYCSCH